MRRRKRGSERHWAKWLSPNLGRALPDSGSQVSCLSFESNMEFTMGKPMHQTTNLAKSKRWPGPASTGFFPKVRLPSWSPHWSRQGPHE